MDLFSLTAIKTLLEEHHAKPQKGLGQNFLVARGVIPAILEAARLSHEDTVLEIGPGIGTLTRELASVAKAVVAVEKDPVMVEILKETTQDLPNVRIIEADILRLDLNLGLAKESLARPKMRYKVVANLPYYITSPAIRMLLEAAQQPERIVVMVQKEVGQRICAKPPAMSLLAVSVQFYASPRIVAYVKKGSFWPQPQVDSAVVEIVPHSTQRNHMAEFFRIVKAGFKQPRKQLQNNLTQGLAIERASIERWLASQSVEPTRRAETLAMEEWIKLAKNPTMSE